jgi:hypothetical protein
MSTVWTAAPVSPGPGFGSVGSGGNAGRSGGGAGGGGFLSAGADAVAISGAKGGDAFPGLAGGLGEFGGGTGGFGGGGGGNGGGGGGGYIGGNGGDCRLGCNGGGGGGSFDAGTDQILVAGFQTGNGEVIITELAAAVPEPASIALLGMSLASLAVVSLRRRTEK